MRQSPQRTGSRTGTVSKLVRHPEPAIENAINIDELGGPWSIVTSAPFTRAAVHSHDGHLLIDLQSTNGHMRMQLTRRDLPGMLRTLAETVGQLVRLCE